MFLNKFVNDVYLDMIYSNYNNDYLNSLDENNFIKIYNLFKKYNFYFINDIILNYLEIFEMSYDDVDNGINKLRDKLGENFVYIIGNNMTYLDEILNIDDEE